MDHGIKLLAIISIYQLFDCKSWVELFSHIVFVLNLLVFMFSVMILFVLVGTTLMCVCNDVPLPAGNQQQVYELVMLLALDTLRVTAVPVGDAWNALVGTFAEEYHDANE